MQADCPLIEFARVYHPMHRIGWIDRARMRDIHLNGIKRFEPAASAREILMNQMKILHP